MKQLKLKQYMFTFEGGGWNKNGLKPLKELYEKEYKDYSNLNPIPSSVHN